MVLSMCVFIAVASSHLFLSSVYYKLDDNFNTNHPCLWAKYDYSVYTFRAGLMYHT